MLINVIYINIEYFLHCFFALITFHHNTFRIVHYTHSLILGCLNKETVSELHIAVFLVIMWLLAYWQSLCCVETENIFKTWTNEHGGGDLVAKSCPTLATQWTVACQAPLSMGLPRQEYCSELPFPSPGHLLDPGIKPMSTALRQSLALHMDSLPLSY